jgi:hypothetical protein
MYEKKDGSAMSLVVLAILLVAAIITSLLLGRRSD